MAMRCPTSTYLGTAKLPGYKWIINERGYANVVQVPISGGSAQDVQEVLLEEADSQTIEDVWGIVYRLKHEDEQRLDKNEGVPYAYDKEMLPTQFWTAKSQYEAPFQGWDDEKVNISKRAEEVDMLVYINRNQTMPDRPKREYIYRMNQGIADALKAGVPHEYVDKVMRKFIPADEGAAEALELALKQASHFEEE